VETSCYAPRRVVRANCSEEIVRPSEVHSTLVSRKCEVYIIPKVKDYIIPVVCKSSVNNPTLVVSKCSDVIPSKFKAVKFTL